MLICSHFMFYNTVLEEERVNLSYTSEVLGLRRWHSGKESVCQCRIFKRHGFSPWVGKIPWKRKCQPAPVFLPGKSVLLDRGAWQTTAHGVVKSGRTTEQLNTHIYIWGLSQWAMYVAHLGIHTSDLIIKIGLEVHEVVVVVFFFFKESYHGFWGETIALK